MWKIFKLFLVLFTLIVMTSSAEACMRARPVRAAVVVVAAVTPRPVRAVRRMVRNRRAALGLPTRACRSCR